MNFDNKNINNDEVNQIHHRRLEFLLHIFKLKSDLIHHLILVLQKFIVYVLRCKLTIRN